MDRREFLASGLSAAPLLLGARTLDWAATAARAPRRHALVSADLEAHVAVVALDAGRVTRRIATREGPRSVAACGGGRALVAHATEGVVTLLDGSPLRVRRVLGGFGEPRYAAVTPSWRHAFVTDSGTGEVAVIDLDRGRVVRRVAVGALARHVTLDPAGRRLWIALGSSAAQLVVVDVSEPLAPRPLRVVRPPFLAHDVGFSPDGRRVWVTAGREPRMAVYAARGRLPIRVVGADEAPQHVTFGRDVAFVASGRGRSVRVHAVRDGVLLDVAHVPFGSYNVQRRGGRVVSPSVARGTLSVLDARGRLVRTVRVARAAHDADIL